MAGKKIGKSLKGEIVDFDLLEIKQKFVSSPKTNNVHERERFIDKRRRRTNINRKISDLIVEQAENQKYAEQIIKSNKEQEVLHKIPEELNPEIKTPDINVVSKPVARKINR